MIKPERMGMRQSIGNIAQAIWKYVSGTAKIPLCPPDKYVIKAKSNNWLTATIIKSLGDIARFTTRIVDSNGQLRTLKLQYTQFTVRKLYPLKENM